MKPLKFCFFRSYRTGKLLRVYYREDEDEGMMNVMYALTVEEMK